MRDNDPPSDFYSEEEYDSEEEDDYSDGEGDYYGSNPCRQWSRPPPRPRSPKLEGVFDALRGAQYLEHLQLVLREVDHDNVRLHELRISLHQKSSYSSSHYFSRHSAAHGIRILETGILGTFTSNLKVHQVQFVVPCHP